MKEKLQKELKRIGAKIGLGMKLTEKEKALWVLYGEQRRGK